MNAHWVKPPKVPQYPRAAARRSHPECGSRLIARRIHAIQEAGDENKKDLAQRVCENSIRIANNIAIGRHARALGKRDIEFAIDLCERSFDAIVGGVERYMFERFEFPRLCEVVFTRSLPAVARCLTATSNAYSVITNRGATSLIAHCATSKRKSASPLPTMLAVVITRARDGLLRRNELS